MQTQLFSEIKNRLFFIRPSSLVTNILGRFQLATVVRQLQAAPFHNCLIIPDFSAGRIFREGKRVRRKCGRCLFRDVSFSQVLEKMCDSFLLFVEDITKKATTKQLQYYLSLSLLNTVFKQCKTILIFWYFFPV